MKHIPEKSQEWFDWLSLEERKTVAAYREKPALLIADYNRERAIARDYEGREILELLQNANDQAAEINQQGRVLIELTEDGLIVANTGLPFSTDGVVSLQTSHLSPKRRGARRLIGNKGLGFRSILNWTRTPVILSDALCISYSVQHAARMLSKLMDSHPELEKLVREETQGSDTLILPLLLFPVYSESGDLQQQLQDSKTLQLFERGEQLILDGYNTIIGMPFDDASKYQQAIEQLKEIRPEILLFAENLSELCFKLGETAAVTWKREGDTRTAEVKADDASLGKWKIFRTKGSLPLAAAEADQGNVSDYEIVVAVPEQTASGSGLLYSHFPTDVSLPLPIVCHATLDLEQNRKHLQQGRRSNKFVLGKVAEFIAEVSENIAESEPVDLWAACSILMSTADFPNDLKRENFYTTVIAAARTKCIVPTLSGRSVLPENARRIIGASSNWLPSRLFPEVAPVRSAADSIFLITLGVPLMSVEEIRERLIDAVDLTFTERIELVTGLLGQDALKSAYTAALLLDSTNTPLLHETRVFLSPSSGQAPALPVWAQLRFLSDDMRETFARRLAARDARELQQKLSGFGLTEYSLGNVISALIAEANRAEKTSPADGNSFRTDLLKAVFLLYEAEPEVRRPSFPERSTIHFPNQANGHSGATSLYLGRGFGVEGEVVQALYGSWASGKLIAFERLPPLTSDPVKLSQFLLWVGVARWPREINEPKPMAGFLQYALSTMKFPAQFEDKVVPSPDVASFAKFETLRSIDGLSEILAGAEPSAVTAWLAGDDRSAGWSKRSADHAKLVAYPDGVHRARTYAGPLPNYVRWCIESTAWLRTADGRALRPKDCVLGERVAEELFPRPGIPDLQTLQRFGIDQRDVLQGWQRAGVLTSLAYLEQDEVYAKLLELPQRSPDGKLARPLYHWLLDANDSGIGGEGVNRSKFLAEGKMWGYCGSEGAYFPLRHLHHTDVEGLPEKLLEKLNIVHLRRRVGAEKVERLFGVKSVDRAGIHRRIVARELAVGSTRANADFQSAKPYLHKLRVSQTTQATQLQFLKELQLEVCSSLRAELIFESTPLEYEVPIWGWLIEEKMLSIRVDPAKPLDIAESLLADAIGEALASIFRIADGGDFARILTCREVDRLVLLRRLGGEAVLEGLDELQAEYAAFLPSIIDVASFPLAKPPTLQATKQPTDLSQDPITHPVPAATVQDPSLPQPLVIIQADHTAAPPPEIRRLLVKTVSPSDPRTGSAHEVTDGDLCELKALEFEESDDQGRWALPVGQVMGTDGPGCDLLSFSSKEARELFGATLDLNMVARFIEVKGRGNSGASIELRGNELTAAEKFGERYFLYRLSQVDNGDFQLTILQNPLKHPEALQASVHVVMQRVQEMKRFVLTGGAQRTSTRVLPEVAPMAFPP